MFIASDRGKRQQAENLIAGEAPERKPEQKIDRLANAALLVKPSANNFDRDAALLRKDRLDMGQVSVDCAVRYHYRYLMKAKRAAVRHVLAISDQAPDFARDDFDLAPDYGRPEQADASRRFCGRRGRFAAAFNRANQDVFLKARQQRCAALFRRMREVRLK